MSYFNHGNQGPEGRPIDPPPTYSQVMHAPQYQNSMQPQPTAPTLYPNVMPANNTIQPPNIGFSSIAQQPIMTQPQMASGPMPAGTHYIVTQPGSGSMPANYVVLENAHVTMVDPKQTREEETCCGCTLTSCLKFCICLECCHCLWSCCECIASCADSN